MRATPCTRGHQSASRAFTRDTHATPGVRTMPIVLFLILVILVAQFGFWDTFQGVLGAVGVVVLLVALLIAAGAVGVGLVMKRMR